VGRPTAHEAGYGTISRYVTVTCDHILMPFCSFMSYSSYAAFVCVQHFANMCLDCLFHCDYMIYLFDQRPGYGFRQLVAEDVENKNWLFFVFNFYISMF